MVGSFISVMALIGLLFIMFVLFGFNNRGTITLVNQTYNSG